MTSLCYQLFNTNTQGSVNMHLGKKRINIE